MICKKNNYINMLNCLFVFDWFLLFGEGGAFFFFGYKELVAIGLL